MHVNQKELILSFPKPERQGSSDANHQIIMEQGKYESTMCKRSLGYNQDKADMVLELFMDNMTINFPNQVAIDERVENSLKRDNIENAIVGILPLPP